MIIWFPSSSLAFNQKSTFRSMNCDWILTSKTSRPWVALSFLPFSTLEFAEKLIVYYWNRVWLPEFGSVKNKPSHLFFCEEPSILAVLANQEDGGCRMLRFFWWENVWRLKEFPKHRRPRIVLNHGNLRGPPNGGVALGGPLSLPTLFQVREILTSQNVEEKLTAWIDVFLKGRKNRFQRWFFLGWKMGWKILGGSGYLSCKLSWMNPAKKKGLLKSWINMCVQNISWFFHSFSCFLSLFAFRCDECSRAFFLEPGKGLRGAGTIQQGHSFFR